jgi:hypothetical protein
VTFVCGREAAPPEALRVLVELRECCLDAIEGGPADCTCWEPVYEVDQAKPNLTLAPTTRTAMCADCAYRPDSPERQGDDRYQDHLGDDAAPFWCHQGMRKPVAYRHPAGITVEAEADHYAPPIHQGVPRKADGTPGDRCAGWAAHHREAASA